MKSYPIRVSSRFALVPDRVNVSLQLSPQLPVQLIEFSISAYWLKDQPNYETVAHYFNDGIIEENEMPLLIAPFSAKAGQLVTTLMGNGEEKQTGAGDVTPEALALITDFLAVLLREETDRSGNNIDQYYDKIRLAETILVKHLQQSAPRMSAIAKTVALSESTLKRYFKLIYGKSVYEYYLTRKIEMARTLLL